MSSPAPRPPRPGPATRRAAPPAARRRRWRTGWCRSPSAPRPAGRGLAPPPSAAAAASSPTAARPPRIGLCRAHLWDLAQPEARDAAEDAAARLERAGAELCEVTLPAEFAALTEARVTINDYEIA